MKHFFPLNIRALSFCRERVGDHSSTYSLQRCPLVKLVFLLAVSLGLLSGCGKGGGTPASQPTPAAQVPRPAGAPVTDSQGKPLPSGVIVNR